MKIRRRLKRSSIADMTPMIDIIFQLVIFFMISSVFNTSPGIILDMPASSTAETVEITPVVITVISEEEIFLNKELYNLETIQEALVNYKKDQVNGPEKVVVKGNENITYSTMVKILDITRIAGYKGANLVTEYDR